MARRFSISEIACFPPKRGSQSAHGVNWQREVLTTLEEFCLGKQTFQNGVEDQRRGVATERERARTHFVEDCPELEQLGASIEFLPSNLLRGHIRLASNRDW